MLAGMLFVQVWSSPLLGIDIADGGPPSRVPALDRRGRRSPRPAHGRGRARLHLAPAHDGQAGHRVQPAAFRFVDVIIGAAVAATLLAVVALVRPGPRGGRAAGLVLLVVLGGVGTAGIALLVLVLRALLAKAVALGHHGHHAARRARRGDLMPIVVDIDVMLARRKMSVGDLADRVGITPANLAVLKNGRAKAVRFSTLEALCEVLDCQPGDLLRHEA